MVEGDGIGYFSYLHTAVIDHDPDFSDEYQAARAAVVRDLLLWPLLHQPFRPLAGIAFLLLEATCLHTARRVAG